MNNYDFRLRDYIKYRGKLYIVAHIDDSPLMIIAGQETGAVASLFVKKSDPHIEKLNPYLRVIVQ